MQTYRLLATLPSFTIAARAAQAAGEATAPGAGWDMPTSAEVVKDPAGGRVAVWAVSGPMDTNYAPQWASVALPPDVLRQVEEWHRRVETLRQWFRQPGGGFRYPSSADAGPYARALRYAEGDTDVRASTAAPVAVRAMDARETLEATLLEEPLRAYREDGWCPDGRGSRVRGSEEDHQLLLALAPHRRAFARTLPTEPPSGVSHATADEALYGAMCAATDGWQGWADVPPAFASRCDGLGGQPYARLRIPRGWLVALDTGAREVLSA